MENSNVTARLKVVLNIIVGVVIAIGLFALSPEFG